jgi:hypothetical protein
MVCANGTFDLLARFAPAPNSRIDPCMPLCYVCYMPEDKAALNLRGVPLSLIRRAKAAAALEGKTLRIFVIEAIQAKIRNKQ